MSEKFRTFAGCMRNLIVHIVSHAHRLVCMLVLVCSFASCGWQEAKEVIVLADSIDQNCHVIYDDTAALGKAIRSLDNPFGRLLMSNTLGKAYYYMGRNLEDDYQQVALAAKCYIEADRLQINDPIYRGRVNVCMGYICKQYNYDSLALIFYERADVDFKGNSEWYYAQTLLDKSELNINLTNYAVADSILLIGNSFQLDSNYQACWQETRGLYFYAQQQYDSALVYFNQGLDYWRTETDKMYSYLKIMQIYLDINSLENALSYAHIIIENPNNPNYLVNAYYCLLLYAKAQQDANLLSKYSHEREDANRLLNENMSNYAEALPILEEYMQNPHPWRWVWITITSFIVLSLLLLIAIIVYRKHTTKHLSSTTSRLQETNLLLQEANKKIDNLSTRIKEQDVVESQPKSSYYFNKNINSIRSEFPAPSNKWNDYKRLKKDIDPWLHNWLRALDQLNLADREKILCVYTLLYPHLSTAKLADYMNYDRAGIRVFKTRMVQKLGIKSSQLPSFLRKLSMKW